MSDVIEERLRETGLPEPEISYLRTRGFSLAQIEIMLWKVWNEEPTVNEKQYHHKILRDGAIGEFDKSIFAIDRLRELTCIGYNPRQLVELAQEDYTTDEIIELARGCLNHNQIRNLRSGSHKSQAQVLNISKNGATVKDILELLVYTLPEQQGLWLEKLDLMSKNLAEVEKRGLSESKLERFSRKKKELGVTLLGHLTVYGRLIKSDIGFEFVFKQGSKIGVFSRVYASDWPLMLTKELQEPRQGPIYLCHSWVSDYFFVPSRDLTQAKHYSLNGSPKDLADFRRFEAFLGK